MRIRTLILRGLFFHWRGNLGVLLGAAVSSAVIVGALGVGDSVRGTMHDLVDSRLGAVEQVLGGGNRFFRASLGDELASTLDVPVASVLQLGGSISAEGGRRRLGGVRILGVDESFWKLWPGVSSCGAPGEDQAVVNSALASRLGLKTGDEILLRAGRAGGPPGDLPLTSDKESGARLRVSVSGIASEKDFGRFSLRADQRWPLNVWVLRSQLGKAAGSESRANLLLLGGPKRGGSGTAETGAALRSKWRAADAGLRFRTLPGGGVELLSERAFLDPPIATAALGAAKGARGVFTYFVNELRRGGKMTPYSFVSAPGGAPVPREMADDEVLINSWLAEDLGAGSGDKLKMTYYLPGAMRGLVERSAFFRVREVVPIAGAAADRLLMPDYPGLTDAEKCGDWDLGEYVDLKKIRPKDETYWERHRGTPKAFVTAAAARRMWANRFGELTAVRYPPGTDRAELSAAIMSRLNPTALGLSFSPVRRDGLQAAARGVDFGGLFLGLSFFIVVAALLLTGLLFSFGAESRARHTGALLALGFTSRSVKRLVLAEGALLAMGGAALGAPGGLLYTLGVLAALSSVWRGAMAGSAPGFHFQLSSLLIGGAAAAACGLAAMWVALRSQLRLTARELLAGQVMNASGPKTRSKWPAPVLAATCVLGAAALLANAPIGRGREAAASFFGAGSLLLVAALALTAAVLRRLETAGGNRPPGAWSMAVRNCARRSGRCLATVGIVSCGVFVLAAVAANRHDPAAGAERRSSGTGGFVLHVETSLPLLHDLATPQGREALGLDGERWRDVSFVQMRVRDGDDASCLNLNRVSRPRLLGVRPGQLSSRGAFAFSALSQGVDPADPWSSLDVPADAAVVPGVADAAVIAWGLGKSLGDTIAYRDERGRSFRVKLVAGLTNSILQGNVLISERAFSYRFPSSAGSRTMLVDMPRDSQPELTDDLSEALRDLGPELQSAAVRLREFNMVESTYLLIFLLLGGVGLLLGTAGSGVLVMRNALERRGEVAVLRAVGFSRRWLCRLVFAENTVLLAWGLICGGSTAAVAVLPAAASPGAQLPWNWLATLFVVLAIVGVAASWLAARLATRGDLLSGLKEE